MADDQIAIMSSTDEFAQFYKSPHTFGVIEL